MTLKLLFLGQLMQLSKVMKECLGTIVKELFDRMLKLEQKLALNTSRRVDLSSTAWPLLAAAGTAATASAAPAAQPLSSLPPPRSTLPQPTLRGKSCSISTSTSITAVPRRLHAFVTRLHLDTTEEDLTKWQEEKGVKAVKCKRITAKDGRTFDTAAFHVSCDPSAERYFYDEDSWPDGAEMRDWIFKQPQPQAYGPSVSNNG